MRESVLHALIHIFAIISTVNPGGVTSRAKKILRSYLRRYLNQELEEEYFRLYESTLDFYRQELKGVAEGELSDENSLITFQITNICRQIKKGLFLQERMIVFLQLLEFVFEDGYISEQEGFIVEIVARTFNISHEEYVNTTSFMFGMHLDDINPDNMLAIEGEDNNSEAATTYRKYEEWHHLKIPGLSGVIYAIFISSTEHIVFVYNGRLPLHFKGRNIVPLRPYLLEPGVNIRAQGIPTIYYTSVFRKFIRDNFVEQINFEGHNIEYHFKGSDNGIQPMSFLVKSGNLIGIMGGSGVGKSTLLNLLNGKTKPDAGSIFVNGYDLHADTDKLEGLIGFVPQDDLLIEELTVYQNLYYNARLSFGNYNDEQLERTINEMLNQLDLNEIRDLTVGDPLNKKISGGQRKRLNIGLELMREPGVLFADEPTSGLSSHDSLKVMELLKEQAVSGRLIFVVIHQPSSDILKMFDRLWVLDKGGYLVYDGDPVEALIYFKTESSQANAAESECPTCGNVETDEILQIVEAKTVDNDGYPGSDRQITPTEWYSRYKKKMAPELPSPPQLKELPQSNFNIPGRANQMRTFLKRNLQRKLADRQYMTINLLESPLLAFILSYFSKYTADGDYVFMDNRNYPVFLFMSVVVALFLGLTVSAEEIFKDRKMLEREKFLNLSRWSYLFSKVTFLFALSAIQTLSYVLVSQLILGPQGIVWKYWLILFTTSCFGNLVGLNISAGMRTVISIYILIPLILVPQLLLGGAMIRFDDLHESLSHKIYVPVVGDVMATRWSYEAMAVVQYKDNRYMKPYFNTEKEISHYDWESSFLIPELKKKATECAYAIDKPEFAEAYKSNMRKLKYHINELSEETGLRCESVLGSLCKEEVTRDDFNMVVNYLDSIQKICRSRFISYSDRRDAITDSLVRQNGKATLLRWKENNYNESLADILLNRTVMKKNYETSDRIIQKSDPVLMMPASRYGRAHFYAPCKMLGRWRIDTLWFNVAVVWIMSVLMFVTLYFNLLKKFIDLIEKIHIPGFGKQRLIPLEWTR
jgi:ABC transport system ATP-binding/permease protein